MTLIFEPNHDLDLKFPRSNFEIAVSQELVVCLAWKDRDKNQYHYSDVIMDKKAS